MFDFDENLLLLALCTAFSRIIEYFYSAAASYPMSDTAGSSFSIPFENII